MSLQRDGVWKGAVWAATVWAQDVWYETAAVLEVIDTHDGEPERRRRQKEKRDALRKDLEGLYDRIILGIEPVAQEAAEIVRPFASNAEVPGLRNIDWEAFIQNMEAIDRMQKLAKRMKEIEDDDDDFREIMDLG